MGACLQQACSDSTTTTNSINTYTNVNNEITLAITCFEKCVELCTTTTPSTTDTTDSTTTSNDNDTNEILILALNNLGVLYSNNGNINKAIRY